MTTEPNTAPAKTNSRKAVVAAPLTTPAEPTKAATVIKLLLRARGATPMELIAATDWQAHSVRAFLSGLRKKQRVLVREARKSGEFAYRLEPVAKPEPVLATPGAVDEAIA
jgi:hypothetical protein